MKVGSVLKRPDGVLFLVLKAFEFRGTERFVITSVSEEPMVTASNMIILIECKNSTYYHVPSIGLPVKRLIESFPLIDSIKDDSTIQSILSEQTFAHQLAMALETI